jgi:uncharacterized protein
MEKLRPSAVVVIATLAAAPLPAGAQGYYPGSGYAPDGYGYRRGPADSYRGGYGNRSSYQRPAPPPAEEPQRFYWPWEDRPAPAPPPPVPRYGYPDQPRTRGYADERPRPRRRPPPPPQRVAAPPAAPAVKPKPDPKVRVAVFGDSLADLVGQGLDEAFSENPDIGVTRKARADTGLVRKDVADWPKLAEDYLKANPKTTFAVAMFAANDHQAIREGDQSFEPLSDRWRELYRDRVDAFLKVFADAKVPVLWVAAPPMKAEALSRDIAAMNDIDRERVQRAGGIYVDIWPAFVDDANRYTPTGPDVDGRTTRLRLGDGVHFTHAGARKAAHFVDVEIKKLMENRGLAPSPGEPVAATPAPEPPADASAALEGGPKGDDTASIDRRITASLPSLPEPPGVPALPVKPVAGPVVPLTRTELSPGGALIAARPRLEGDTGRAIERSLVRGNAAAPQPGRADDFTWSGN